MQGGQRRDFVVLRMALGIACVAVVGLIAAPIALANTPAGDQYGSALPGGGNSGNDSGSSPSGSTTIPVAPDSSSSSQTATGDSSATKAKANDTGSKGGGSSHDGHRADTQKGSGKGSGGPGAVNLSNPVPQIAADSAGDSWLPFFIGGMVALACAAAALVFFRNRRRTAQG